METHVLERAVDELAWLASAVQQVHDAGTDWSDVGVLSRDNAQAEEVYDALTSVGIPVEIVGLSGLIRLPEVAEVVATLTLLHDVTANSSMLTLLTGPRWAIGPRDLRSARPARGRDRRRPRTPGGCLGRRPAPPDRRRDRRRRAARAQRCRRVARRRGVLTRGARALRAAGCRAAAAAQPRRRPAARRGPSHHRHDRSRRGARVGDLAGRGRAARQPRPVRQGRRGVPVRRRRRDAAGPAGLPHRRGRPGQRPRRRHADRRRLGQAAHRPPRQGPGVVVGLLRRGGGDPLPQQPVAHALDVVACGPARAAARRPCRPAPAGRPRQGRTRRLPRRDPCPRRRGGAAPGLRRLHPRRPPPGGDVVRLGAARDAVRAVGLPTGGARPARGVGRAGRSLAREADGQGTQPQRRRRPLAPVAGARSGRGGAPQARRRRARAHRRPHRTRPGPRHGRGRTGRGVGRRPCPAAHRGTRRARHVGGPAAPRQPVRDLGGPAARRPRDIRPRAGATDAAAAGAGRTVRHRLPRVGRGPVRPAGADRARRAAGSRRRRHRRRGRPR